jgi:NitT/TauT family transport system permease protein
VKPAALLLILLAIWQLVSDAFRVPTFLLPSPLLIASKLIEIPDVLAANTLVTLREVMGGFTLSVVVGITLAILIAHSRLLAESLYPLLVISQEIPQVAIAPILVIWFGHGDLPKVIVAFFISFFPMVVNTAVGLLGVDEDLLYLIRGLNASRWQVLAMIRLPNALPYIFTGMRVSITLAVIGAVVGEFVGGTEGLGYLVFTGTGTLNTRLTFAAIVVLALLGLALFWLVALVERLVLPWLPERAEGAV